MSTDADLSAPSGRVAGPVSTAELAPELVVSPEPAVSPELVVSRWVDAFNARSLDGMLADLHREVVFHPLRFAGLAGGYHGHDGVCEWFAHLSPTCHEHRIDLAALEVAADGRVLAAGNLCLGGRAAIAPFGAIHSFDDGMIIEAHHYFSDQTLLRRLGLFP